MARENIASLISVSQNHLITNQHLVQVALLQWLPVVVVEEDIPVEDPWVVVPEAEVVWAVAAVHVEVPRAVDLMAAVAEEDELNQLNSKS